MLDYDDFNSQHASESLQMVVEEVIRHTGYDKQLGDKLVRSLKGGFVYVGGRCVGELAGTLMSGHRGTSFLNSILNAAYLRVYVPEYERYASIHVGDDVYMCVQSMKAAGDVLMAIKESPLRMNPTKQSVGPYTAEFLRMAFGHGIVWGYLARAIASTVSGNWQAEFKMEPLAALRTMTQNAWTLVMRSANEEMADGLVSAVTRVSGLNRAIVREILHGRVAINDGPVRGRQISVKKIWLEEIREEQPGARLRMTFGCFATADYLKHHCDRVEHEGMSILGHGVKQAMINASYGRALAELSPNETGLSHLKAVNAARKTAVGVSTVTEALAVHPQKGCLSQYPLLQLMKNGFRESGLKDLLHFVGVNPGVDPWVTAWGSEARGVVIDGCLPYSDACHLGGRIVNDVLYVETPVRV